MSKRARLESVTPWLQDYRERVLFHPQAVQAEPRIDSLAIGGKDPVVIEITRPLRSQLLDFPTTHEDGLDAYVQGLRFIRQWVLPYENEDEDEDIKYNPKKDVDLNIRVIST
jgi:hypothetical protein